MYCFPKCGGGELPQPSIKLSLIIANVDHPFLQTPWQNMGDE